MKEFKEKHMFSQDEIQELSQEYQEELAQQQETSELTEDDAE